MPVSLTEKEFSQHVGTKFHLKTDEREIELELIEVKGYVSQEIEQGISAIEAANNHDDKGFDKELVGVSFLSPPLSFLRRWRRKELGKQK